MLEKYRFHVSRRIHRYCRDAIRGCASTNGLHQCGKEPTSNTRRENRKEKKKKNEVKNELNSVGVPWGPEGGPGRIVIGVDVHTAGTEMTIKRWGRCRSL